MAWSKSTRGLVEPVTDAPYSTCTVQYQPVKIAGNFQRQDGKNGY